VSDEVEIKHKTQVATPADLAAAREARGMSQVDISHRIKLQVRQVNALEEGQWEALPGKSFVRGALRSYAKLLDVDVAPLLESIGGFAEPTQVHGMHALESSMSRASGHGFNGGGRGSPILWVIAGLVGVVALVLYFGTDQDASRIRSWLPSTDMPAGSPPAAEPASGTDAPAPAIPDTSSSTSVATSSGFGSGESTQAGTSPSGSHSVLSALQVLPSKPPGAAASAPGLAQAPAAAGNIPGGAPGTGDVAGSSSPAALHTLPDAGALAAIPPGQRPLQGAAPASGTGAAAPGVSSVAAADSRGLMQVKALDDAWIEVRQADGSALHNGLVKAGSRIDLKGSPPYRLVLGNASRVELSYEGKAQDLAPHTRANNIARLQLR
jgi:cytoskeleton protein RodZ